MTSPSPVTDDLAPSLPACVPCVRLFADRVLVSKPADLSCEMHETVAPLIALSFSYGGARVCGDDRGDGTDTQDGAVEGVVRDGRAEDAARRVLERLGAVELACFEAIEAPLGCDAEYVVRADADHHAFCAFTARALDEWRALGWHVEVDPAYPFGVVEREATWYAEVGRSDGDERPDWFSFELGVEIDGVRVDLLAVVLELIERIESEGGFDALANSCRPVWALRVDDTRHVSVPLDRLKAIARVVAELYQGSQGSDAAFPKVRAAALAALDEEFRGGGVRLTWTDPAGVVAPSRARAATLEAAPCPRGLQATLRPYQAQGLAFLQRLRHADQGGVLADDMGLGKTLQTIAHICAEHAAGRLDAPALVVAPTSLVGNWSRELARFAPELRVVVIHGPERKARWAEAQSAHVVVTTYPVLVRDEARFAEATFHLAVLDEAQAIKNARCRARRALDSVSARHRVCLTGTPVENHLGELWSLFDWLAPGLLGDELSFRRFWRHPIEVEGARERLDALRALVAPFVLRRLKSEVATELPPKTELRVPIELDGPQRELYESIRAAAHAEVRRAIRAKGIAASAVAILDALTKLRQVCCDPRLVALESARTVRDSAKLDALMELLSRELAGGHRILVFSQFTSMLALVSEALAARGVRHLVLTGATRDRQRVIDAFEKGQADVLLISLKAGGTGLNLVGADTVVHYDPWWNPAAQAQATDRAYRIGQTRPVFVHNLYVAGSVEERVLALQERKRSLSTALLGDGASGAPLGEGEIDALFAPLEG